MVKIKFLGWQIGMRPIPFIKLLNKKAGLSLVKSKEIKDKIVDEGQTIEISIRDEKIAHEIIFESQKNGVICKLIEE
jgi:hypothetical protein